MSLAEIGTLRRHAGCTVTAPSLEQSWDYTTQVLGRIPQDDDRPLALYWCQRHHVWLTDGLPEPEGPAS